MAFKDKITAIDGKAYTPEELVRYNFICIGGKWNAGPRLNDEQLKQLHERGSTIKNK